MKPLEILKKQSFGILGSLSLQYLLGMVINMFGVSPDDPKYSSESPLVKIAFIVHGINGLILPIFALIMFIFATKSGNKVLKNTALYGFISVITAAAGGISTIILKDNASEIASLVMATAFLIAIIIYVRFYFLLRNK